MIELKRIGNLLVRTSEILTESNERNFQSLKEKEKNIINLKITNLIEQLEDSVKQSEEVLNEKDQLSSEVIAYKTELESMQKILNNEVISVKNKQNENIGKLEQIIVALSKMEQSCNDQNKNLEEMGQLYGQYTHDYHSINESISKSIEISDIEISRGESLEEHLLSLSEQTEQSGDQIKAVFKGMDNIREVTDIINDVAEKASILSLNAAIESAHAGEAGKGFAVVAEEVGVLADRTAEHAEFINESLFSVTDLIKESSYSDDLNDSSYSTLHSGLKEMIHSFKTINSLLEQFTRIEKPLNFSLTEESMRDVSTLDGNVKALQNLKKEMYSQLEVIGSIPLLKGEVYKEQSQHVKISLHDTAVKTVKDEDLEEEVEA